jgi:hypothetical protein
MALNLENRKRVEREIVASVVKAAVAKGFTFYIDNGGDDDECVRTEGEEATLAAMFATDEDRLIIYDPKSDKPNLPLGMFHFVYGNDGWDVLSDYTSCQLFEGLTTEANSISEKYQ